MYAPGLISRFFVPAIPYEFSVNPLFNTDSLIGFAESEKFVVPKPFHVVPFDDIATVLVPVPVAINMDPFHTILYPAVEKIVLCSPFQLLPSVDNDTIIL